MSRPANIYQQVPSIKVGDKIFQTYEQAAQYALEELKPLQNGAGGLNSAAALFVVHYRAEDQTGREISV